MMNSNSNRKVFSTRCAVVIAASVLIQSTYVNAFSISSTPTSSFALKNGMSTSIDMSIRSKYTTRNSNINININSNSRTCLQLFGNDDNNAGATTTTTPPPLSKSILEPGALPTIVITPDESSAQIYQSAIKRTIAWVAAAAAFGLTLYQTVGSQTGEEFFAGYLLEQSLSIDNLLVFLLLFDYFKVPLQNQDKILNYGIYGAIVMRAVMIGLGSVALRQFHAVLLVFASILIYSSFAVLFGDDSEEDDEDMAENKIVQFSKNLFDASENFDGDRFFTLEDGIRKATPLFICMVAVEVSDVVFAVDSIPAVFGVTENPLVVFTSNMFAIMGLRSLYTILSKAASDLEYLEPAVAIVLGFVGSKLVGEYFGYEIPTIISLGVVATFLGGGVGLSLWSKNQKGMEEQ
jgi:TerC family integral membrane protein